jgi:hypothetical protein
MTTPALLRSGSFEVTDRQRDVVRVFCIALALIQAVIGFGLIKDFDWAIEGWPLPDVKMTYKFLASIAAAIAAPCAWVVWRNELGALQGVGFELMVGQPALGGYLLWLAADRRELALAILGIALLVFGVIWAAVYLWSKRVPIRDTRPLPGLFRASFIVICAILVVLGVALTLQVDNIFPWAVSPENSTVIGFIFLSAALLFGWIVVHPTWVSGEMALTSFLAYGMVLVFPYIDLWRNRNDAETVSSYYGSPSYATGVSEIGINERSLVMYMIVLGVGIALAVAIYVWRLAAPHIHRLAPAASERT